MFYDMINEVLNKYDTEDYKIYFSSAFFVPNNNRKVLDVDIFSKTIGIYTLPSIYNVLRDKKEAIHGSPILNILPDIVYNDDILDLPTYRETIDYHYKYTIPDNLFYNTYKIFTIGRDNRVIGAILIDGTLLINEKFIHITTIDKDKYKKCIEESVRHTSIALNKIYNLYGDNEYENTMIDVFTRIYNNMKGIDNEVFTNSKKLLVFMYNQVNEFMLDMFDNPNLLNNSNVIFSAIASKAYKNSLIKYNKALSTYKEHVYKTALYRGINMFYELTNYGFVPMKGESFKLIKKINIIPSKFILDDEYYKLDDEDIGTYYINDIILDMERLDGSESIILETFYSYHPNIRDNIICAGDKNRSLLYEHQSFNSNHSFIGALDTTIKSLEYMNLDSAHFQISKSIQNRATYVEEVFHLDPKEYKPKAEYSDGTHTNQEEDIESTCERII